MRSLWLVHLWMLSCALSARHSEKKNGTSVTKAETERVECNIMGIIVLLYLGKSSGRAALGLDQASPVPSLDNKVDLNVADKDRRPHQWRGNKYFWEDDFHFREIVLVGKTLSDNVDVVKFQDGKSYGIAKVVYDGAYEKEERLASFAEKYPARFLNPLRDIDGHNVFADVEKSTPAYLTREETVVYKSLQHGQELSKKQWKNVRFVPSRIITKKREYTNFRMYLYEKATMSLKKLVHYDLRKEFVITLHDKVRLMAEVLDAVHLMHKKNVFHMSLSAEHVVLFKGGRFEDRFYHAKLCSFSKSQSPTTKGSEAERLRHKDLSALGLMFYKLLYGIDHPNTPPKQDGRGIQNCFRSLRRTDAFKKARHEAKLEETYKDISQEQSEAIDAVLEALSEEEPKKHITAKSVLAMLQGGFPKVTLGEVADYARAPKIWNMQAGKAEPTQQCSNTQPRSGWWISFTGGKSQSSSLVQRSPGSSKIRLDDEKCPDVTSHIREEFLQVYLKICSQEKSSSALPKPFDDPMIFDSLTHVGPFAVKDLKAKPLKEDPEDPCGELLQYLNDHEDVQFLIDLPMDGHEAMKYVAGMFSDVVVVD
eukprot:TRINITY_DN1244_c0_g2_i1.p1 TRINITY_DN1244_c0_g2~~TRINITY_DN1244_c0_g2_i1.p1  ORF type:complete len:593 (+),score=55.82 TRINITY_DN1244_c0_g2_i1:90-1868(+)